MNLEIGKTSYYKQYINGFILSICMLLILEIGLISGLFFDETVSATVTIICMLILIGFASLMCLLFWFKRFDLMKQYYDDKIEK